MAEVQRFAHALAEQVRPAVSARDRVLPVRSEWEGLFPDGLRRGSTLSIDGPAAWSAALSLAAGPSAAGGWVIVVGVPGLNARAAGEHGVVLDRLVLVSLPAPRLWAEAVAAAFDGADVVLSGVPPEGCSRDLRRVQARLARSQAVMAVVEGQRCGAYQPDVRVATSHPRWEGTDAGAGRLTARAVRVEVAGRRVPRPRRQQMLLPGPGGAVESAVGAVSALRGAS